MTIVIRDQNVPDLVNPSDALSAVRACHMDMYEGAVDNVTRTRARSPKMSLHSLSAASTKLGRGCAKVYSATRYGVRSLVLLYDLSSGELIAIIEANELGRMRTAAASILSAQVMMSAPPQVVALIGTGYQAWGVIESLNSWLSQTSACDNQSELSAVKGDTPQVLVYSRSAEARAEFAHKLEKLAGNISIRVTESAEESVSAAQLIITATTSSSPVLELAWLKNAKHIAALGSNALSRAELPPQAVTAAKIVVVDCKETAHAEAGNLLKPLENGKLLWSQVRELSEILNNPIHLRSAQSGYTLFSSQGLAAQDLYLASVVYDKAAKEGLESIAFFNAV